MSTLVPVRILACAWLACGVALAQGRPSEEDLFGAPPQEPPARPEPAPQPPAQEQPPPAKAQPPDERLAAEPGAESRLGAALARTTLEVGGQLYLRANGAVRQGDPPSRWDLTSPSLLDVYGDARPNDRVRAFVLVRTQYDPTAEEAPASPLPGLAPVPGEDGTGGVPAPGAGTLGGARATRPTEVALDQLWVRFDAGRRAFFTAGKQHVKWGVGRFWNPTDFLHSAARDPLASFDARTGTAMVRLQVPWERLGWSLQAAAILEPLVPARDEATPRSGQLGALGGALRAEAVVGGAEVGVGGVVQKGRPARLGLDVSAGVWELDVYGELALRSAPERPLWREVDASLPLAQRFQRFEPGGANPSAVVGASWSWRYGDDDALTVGAEYAYDRDGYEGAEIYPWLLLNDALAAVPGSGLRAADVRGDFAPFQLGRHYAGAYLALPSPGTWNDASFTLSTLGNLSDGSFVSRLDGSLVVLTHVRLEAFVGARYGHEGGEFRLGLDLPSLATGVPAVPQTPALRVGAPLLDLGVALRVAL